MKHFRYAVYIVCMLVVVGIIFYSIQMLRKASNSGFTFRTNSETVVKELKELNRLETASYTIEKVIDAGTSGNAFQEFLYGDRILLIAHGQIIAGFDMSRLSKKDIKISDRSITIILPQPEILITTLDNNQTRVYDRKQGLLTKGNKDLESQARVVAQEKLRSAACQGNILSTASDNARKQLTAFLKALGFVSVTINIPEGSC